MPAPTDASLNDPMRVFDDMVHTLATEALDRDIKCEDLLQEIKANSRERNKKKMTTWDQLVTVIEKADPSFSSSIMITRRGLISPSDLKELLDSTWHEYCDQLLRHYLRAKMRELRAARAATAA